MNNESVGFTYTDANIEPNTITFNSSASTWVMQITADRKIIVNEDVEVSEAAQAVLDALQPLLLKPHPAKTLTDEEINQLWAESHEDGIAIQQGFTTQQHYFARAILRKAQEK
jgi:hypothetical protein